MKNLTTLLVAFCAIMASTQAFARDQIRIVGSSTVYPFTTTVAEQFSKTTQFKAPVVESTGTGGGFKLFCAGVGVNHPDFNDASRAIKQSEIKKCEANGVTGIIEIKVGYDGIVLANSKDGVKLNVTTKELFMALAKQVPDETGKLVDNPYTTWDQINPLFPKIKIEVFGPPPTSGTRDAFVELVMESGAKQFPSLKKLGKNEFKHAAHPLREDGHFIEAGENDNLIIQKLVANSSTYGIFGFSFLDQNVDKLYGAQINGVEPTFENISNGSYPISRALYVYAKRQHLGVIHGMKEFIDEYLSEGAFGSEGYLSDKGLIPLTDKEQSEVRAKAILK